MVPKTVKEDVSYKLVLLIAQDNGGTLKQIRQSAVRLRHQYMKILNLTILAYRVKQIKEVTCTFELNNTVEEVLCGIIK